MKIFEKDGAETSLRPSEMILEIGATRDALMKVVTCLDAKGALKVAVKFVSNYYGFKRELSVMPTATPLEEVLVKTELSDDEDFPYCVATYTGGEKKILEFFETREEANAFIERRLAKSVDDNSKAAGTCIKDEEKIADIPVEDDKEDESELRHYKAEKVADKLGVSEQKADDFLSVLGL